MKLRKHIKTAKAVKKVNPYGRGEYLNCEGTTTAGVKFTCYRGGARGKLFVHFSRDGFTAFPEAPRSTAIEQAVKRTATELGV